MARKSIFNLSVEEELLEQDVVEVEPTTVEEQIEAEENVAEITEDSAELQDSIVAIEEAEEVVEELEEQVEQQEEVIEAAANGETDADGKPVEITEDTVAIAQEAYCLSLGKISNWFNGYEEIRSKRLSIESDSSITPVQKLQVLSQETIADTIKNIIEHIKQAIKSFGLMLKKLLVKFVLWSANVEKTANSLINAVKKSNKKEFDISTDINEKIKKTNGIYYAAGLNDAEICKTLIDSKKITHVFSSFEKVSDIKEITDEKVEKAVSALGGTLTSIDKVISYVAKNVKEEGIVIPTRLTGNEVKYIVLNEKDFTIKQNVKTVDFDYKVKDKITVGALIAGINAYKAAGASIKTYGDTVFKIADKATAIVSKMEIRDESVLNQKFGKAAKLVLNGTRLVATSYAYDSIMSLYATVKANMSIFGAIIKTNK